MHKLAVGAGAAAAGSTKPKTLARESLELTIRTVGRGHQIVASSRLPLLAEILDLQRRYAEADRTYAVGLRAGAHERQSSTARCAATTG